MELQREAVTAGIPKVATRVSGTSEPVLQTFLLTALRPEEALLPHGL